MNTVGYFEIQSDDPLAAVRFYQAIFGWRFTKAEGLPVPYWRIEDAGVRGGLLQRPAPAPLPGTGTNAYVVSIEVEDFDEVEKAIVGAGGIVALPRFAVPGVCWQGYFVDPDGNTFGLFQPDSDAK